MEDNRRRLLPRTGREFVIGHLACMRRATLLCRLQLRPASNLFGFRGRYCPGNLRGAQRRDSRLWRWTRPSPAAEQRPGLAGPHLTGLSRERVVRKDLILSGRAFSQRIQLPHPPGFRNDWQMQICISSGRWRSPSLASVSASVSRAVLTARDEWQREFDGESVVGIKIQISSCTSVVKSRRQSAVAVWT
jgi:hypothetical protein